LALTLSQLYTRLAYNKSQFVSPQNFRYPPTSSSNYAPKLNVVGARDSRARSKQ